MKKMIAMLLALVMALSLAACGEKANDGNTDNDTAKTELVLGTSADYAPFEFMYPDDSGEMVYGGIDVSVAKYIAEDMGLTLKVENMGFDYLLPSLDKGDFDIVLAAMEATPERLENADFSDPYYYEARRVVVRADDDSINGPEDLNGKKIALFGSYGWGDGQWMRDWVERAQGDGAQVLNGEGLICHETPDEDGLSECRELGKQLANA